MHSATSTASPAPRVLRFTRAMLLLLVVVVAVAAAVVAMAAALTAPQPSLRHVGAGMGTTGTHAAHEAMCASNLSACHWDHCCGKDAAMEAAHEAAVYLYIAAVMCAASGVSNGIHPKCREGIAGGEKLRRGVWAGNQCWQKHRCCPRHAATLEVLMEVGCSAGRWADAIRAAMRRVAGSGLQGVSDVPYPAVLPTVTAALPEGEQKQLRLLLTTRAPERWIQRRIAKHGRRNIICRGGTGLDSRFGDMERCARLTRRAAGPEAKLWDAFMVLPDANVSDVTEALGRFQDVHVPKVAQQLGAQRNLLRIDVFQGKLKPLRSRTLTSPSTLALILGTVNGEEFRGTGAGDDEDKAIRNDKIMHAMVDWFCGGGD
mmetsp:Transcript_27993/g.89205  ORF Transcript_27993/g.89205 Transcript_27993/m.89205 type:complete len:373 (-) Transcript_27993:2669-3787(-)